MVAGRSEEVSSLLQKLEQDVNDPKLTNNGITQLKEPASGTFILTCAFRETQPS